MTFVKTEKEIESYLSEQNDTGIIFFGEERSDNFEVFLEFAKKLALEYKVIATSNTKLKKKYKLNNTFATFAKDKSVIKSYDGIFNVDKLEQFYKDHSYLTPRNLNDRGIVDMKSNPYFIFFKKPSGSE